VRTKLTRFAVIAAGLLSATGVVAQVPLNPGLEIENGSRTQITEVHVKPNGNNNWGANKLGETLRPGNTASIREMTETNCLYDVKAVYEDGRADEREKVNVCGHQRLVFGAPQ
jgi:hypothetical protein